MSDVRFRLDFYLEEAVYRAVEALAAQKSLSVNGYLRDLIECDLQSHPAPSVAESKQNT